MTWYPSPSVPDHFPPSPPTPLCLLVSSGTVCHPLHQHPKVGPSPRPASSWLTITVSSPLLTSRIALVTLLITCSFHSILSPMSLALIPLQAFIPMTSVQTLSFAVPVGPLKSQFQLSSLWLSHPSGNYDPWVLPLFLIPHLFQHHVLTGCHCVDPWPMLAFVSSYFLPCPTHLANPHLYS